MKHQLILELHAVEEYFLRSTRCFQEEHSLFVVKEGMLTVAQQIAHVATTVDWFVEGIDNPEGFDLDFESHWETPGKCESVVEAKAWFSQAIERAVDKIQSMSEEELYMPLVAGPVMGGQPRYAVVGGISDHSAHHRGALTVYARLCGLIPAMPYTDLPD